MTSNRPVAKIGKEHSHKDDGNQRCFHNNSLLDLGETTPAHGKVSLLKTVKRGKREWKTQRFGGKIGTWEHMMIKKESMRLWDMQWQCWKWWGDLELNLLHEVPLVDKCHTSVYNNEY